MKKAILIFGATAIGSPEFSADLFWRTGGFTVPDPVIFCEIDGKRILLLSSLEIERGRSEADVEEIVSVEKYYGRARSEGVPVSVLFLRDRGVEEVSVPETLRYSLGEKLKEHFKVDIRKTPFYSERAKKNKKELREIRRVQTALESSLNIALDYLRKTEIKGKGLFHEDYPDSAVTSGQVRKIIETDLYKNGFLAFDTIVSCGQESADPHSKGLKKLEPCRPIVIDIFPRSLSSLYFADMTRTVFKGEPNKKYKKMYNAVLKAQETAIGEIKNGADGKMIEKNVRDYFDKEGFTTLFDRSPVCGFIHSLGHGVGLDIHEGPRFGTDDSKIETGNIITIEPGLYYHEETSVIPKGGIRIEDMLLVTNKGSENLTKFPKRLDDMII